MFSDDPDHRLAAVAGPRCRLALGVEMTRNVDREGPIQAAIVEFLRTQYPRALIFSVPNELASKAGGGQDRAMRQTTIRNVQSRAKAQGMLPGMSDLCVLIGGRFFALEVKAKGNGQQPSQEAVQDIVERNGGIYAVVRSVDDVRSVLTAQRGRDGYADLHRRIMPDAADCMGEGAALPGHGEDLE